MIRTFKEMESFTKKWNALGLTEDDLTEKEKALLAKLVKCLKEV